MFEMQSPMYGVVSDDRHIKYAVCTILTRYKAHSLESPSCPHRRPTCTTAYSSVVVHSAAVYASLCTLLQHIYTHFYVHTNKSGNGTRSTNARFFGELPPQKRDLAATLAVQVHSSRLHSIAKSTLWAALSAALAP
eukprot:19743-Heterococcus_DN1.PRE.1